MHTEQVMSSQSFGFPVRSPETWRQVRCGCGYGVVLWWLEAVLRLPLALFAILFLKKLT